MNCIEDNTCAQQMRFDFTIPGKTPGRDQEAQRKRDNGIKRAIDHANIISDNWSEKAYRFLKGYISGRNLFMTEQVREAAMQAIPEPPSARAWGGVIVRAVKEGLITRAGYQAVQNTKAHCTPATVWRVN